MPTALDMPKEITNEIVDSYEVMGPWGVKEVGEGSTNPTMGCFRNAIADAMGVSVNTLPITYEKVWRAMKEKKEGKVPAEIPMPPCPAAAAQ